MLAFLVVTALASADADLRLLVVASDATDRTEALYGGLRAAGLLVVDLEERTGVDLPAPPRAPLGTRDAARAKLLESRAKLRDLDTIGAHADVDAALDEVMRLEHPEDAKEIWIDALLVRANLALVEERSDDARADLELVSRLDPGRDVLHPGLYPPSLVEAYSAAREAALQRPPATLVVRARAAGFAPTSVLVDGQPFAGAALPAGFHAVTVRAQADGKLVGQRTAIVELSDAQTTVLAPFLAPADATLQRARLVDAARRATSDVERTRALEQLAAACAAKGILFEHPSVPKGRALFVAGRGLVPVESVSSDPIAVGEATLDALQAPRIASNRGPPPPTPDDEGSIWPFAALGTGGVAFIGASIATGFVAWWNWPPADGAVPDNPPPIPVRVRGYVS